MEISKFRLFGLVVIVSVIQEVPGSNPGCTLQIFHESIGSEKESTQPRENNNWVATLSVRSVLPKDRSFTTNSDTEFEVLPKSRSTTANSVAKVAVLLVMNWCGSFPLLSAPHSLFSIWTYLKSSEKIPGAPAWRRGEWIWLTGLSGLYQNSVNLIWELVQSG